jgi:hypothetical protein
MIKKSDPEAKLLRFGPYDYEPALSRRMGPTPGPPHYGRASLLAGSPQAGGSLLYLSLENDSRGVKACLTQNNGTLLF